WIDTELPLSKLVPARLLACVVSCSTTVTRSPARKARLSEVIDHGAPATNTPPPTPWRTTGAGVGGSASGCAGGCTSGGATAAQADSSVAASRAARRARRG